MRSVEGGVGSGDLSLQPMICAKANEATVMWSATRWGWQPAWSLRRVGGKSVTQPIVVGGVGATANPYGFGGFLVDCHRWVALRVREEAVKERGGRGRLCGRVERALA